MTRIEHINLTENSHGKQRNMSSQFQKSKYSLDFNLTVTVTHTFGRYDIEIRVTIYFLQLIYI